MHDTIQKGHGFKFFFSQGAQTSLTFKISWVTKTEFLLTISIQYQAHK